MNMDTDLDIDTDTEKDTDMDTFSGPRGPCASTCIYLDNSTLNLSLRVTKSTSTFKIGPFNFFLAILNCCALLQSSNATG
jgi:hypothetical protein